THRALGRRQAEAATTANPPVAVKPKEQPAAALDRALPEQRRTTVTGRVLGPDDKPVADADVALLGRPRLELRVDQQPSEFIALGQGKTAADGHFCLTVPRISKDRYWEVSVLARASGYGLGDRELDADAAHSETEIR